MFDRQSKDEWMATSITVFLSCFGADCGVPTSACGPQASYHLPEGHALEILGLPALE